MKAITMYHPNILQNTLSDFDRYLESFFENSTLPTTLFNNMPAMDIKETEAAYVMDVELPGYDEDSIDVHIDNGKLTIASKYEEKHEKKEGTNFLLHERRVNSFSRCFNLPENADPESINASFKNGILNMEIKKRPESQKRTIQINAA